MWSADDNNHDDNNDDDDEEDDDDGDDDCKINSVLNADKWCKGKGKQTVYLRMVATVLFLYICMLHISILPVMYLEDLATKNKTHYMVLNAANITEHLTH